MPPQPQPLPTDPDEVLTLMDLARIFKLGSRKTAERALHDGDLPVPCFYVRGQPRWTWREVRRWLRVRHHPPARHRQVAPPAPERGGGSGQKRPSGDTGH